MVTDSQLGIDFISIEIIFMTQVHVHAVRPNNESIIMKVQCLIFCLSLFTGTCKYYLIGDWPRSIRLQLQFKHSSEYHVISLTALSLFLAQIFIFRFDIILG